MTPDEVVKNTLTNAQELGLIAIFHSDILSPEEKLALKTAISLLQDYQKLRERIDVKEIRDLLLDQNPIQEWESLSQHKTRLAQSIITYLQQPTEH